MQDQFMSRAIPARPIPYSPITYNTTPRQPQSWRKPAAAPGLTQAQLQQIVLEQLG